MTSFNVIKISGVDFSLPFPRLRPPAFIVRLTTAFPGCNKRQILGFHRIPFIDPTTMFAFKVGGQTIKANGQSD